MNQPNCQRDSIESDGLPANQWVLSCWNRLMTNAPPLLGLVLLSELGDMRAVPIPPLPVGSGSGASRPSSRPFRRGILAILFSAQSAKSHLLLVIACARWRKIVRRELPKSKVECRTRAKSKSDRSGGMTIYPGPVSEKLTQLPRLPPGVRFSSRHRTARPAVGAIELPLVSG